MRVATVILVALAGPAAAFAQAGYDRYEARYGTPVDVSLTDLVHTPHAYQDKAVRVTARFGLAPGMGARYYVLEEGLALSVRLLPVPEVAPNFESEAIQMMGQQVQVTGVFFESTGAGEIGNAPAGVIQFWSYVGPPEPDAKGQLKALQVSLEALVSDPGRRDGQAVRVVGQFRGKNLYGDLPARSQRDSKDWVIKDSLFAVWVTGRKAQGDGWKLDSDLKRDTGKWIEVVGRPETRGGVTYLQAVRVSLSAPPSASARVEPPPPPPERPKMPPVVVFALPLDGDVEVPPDAQFRVQFSKDMNQASFEGRVLLRYAGPQLPGDRAFDALRLTYDEGRRALIVDPGDVLRRGRELELLLLPGIADADGLTLAPRHGAPADEAVEVLRYQVGG